MKRHIRFLLVSAAVGLLTLATTVPTLAQGPADRGLGTAVTAAANSFDVGANRLTGDEPPATGLGNHLAACTIGDKNPATSLDDPNCP